MKVGLHKRDTRRDASEKQQSAQWRPTIAEAGNYRKNNRHVLVFKRLPSLTALLILLLTPCRGHAHSGQGSKKGICPSVIYLSKPILVVSTVLVMHVDVPIKEREKEERHLYYLPAPPLQAQPVTAIWVTHRFEELDYADAVSYMQDGRVVFTGKPADMRTFLKRIGAPI
eukprot:1152562-Pelagomonas_calceolata.AAC.2